MLKPSPRWAAVFLIVLLLTGPVFATWSIIIVDLATGEVAIGSATCLTSFDLLQLSPVVIVGVGAAAAQSQIDFGGINRVFIRNQLLLGTPPGQIVSLLAMTDPNHQVRQYGIVDTTGGQTAFTGSGAFAYAGHLTGQSGTLRYAIQGNVITGQPVLLQAEQSIINTPGDLAAKLMAAMQAARAMGGDGRCSCSPVSPTACGSPPASFTKSADIGYMVVARPGDVDGPCAAAPGCASGTYFMKHNVAFQTSTSLDPVIQLQNLYNAWRAAWTGRPDHFRSTVTFSPPDLPTNGTTQTLATVQLIDWQGTPVPGSGATLTVTVDPSSTAAVTVGTVGALGGGAYQFPVTAGVTAGAALLRIVVNDGQGPVLRWPRPVLSLTGNALWSSATQLFAGPGGTIDLALQTGSAYAGRGYALALSANGSTPGIAVSPGVVVPLNPDPIFFLSLALAGSPVLPNSVGTLNATGRALVQLVGAPGAFVPLQGLVLTVAYATTGPVDFASNPVAFTVVP